MKQLSLKWKIYLVGLVPFSFYLFSMFSSLYDNYAAYNESVFLMSKMKVIEAASAVVHETQKERGKSAGYLNGGVKLESLNDQRAINDKKHSVLRKEIDLSPFDDKYKKEIHATLDSYEELRSNITDKKIALGPALKSYTGIIKRFLDIELDVANVTKFPEVAASIKGFRFLEDAKESGGKLRANMTGILAKNGPITDKKFSTIISLKAGVDEGLKSSGLILDQESIDYIKKFNSSAEWVSVNESFRLILKNSDKGAFDKDAAVFFSTITNALNILGELIIYQKTGLTDLIVGLKDQAVASLWKTSLMVVVFVVGLFFFVTLMTTSITKKITSIIESLMVSSKNVSNTSVEIASTSNQLSEVSTEQAQSLQETVASIDEISSMVKRNADAAESSTSASEESKQETTQGKMRIDEMIVSIGDIANSNQEIMDEMQHNNTQINTITSVIAEIGEKTKVINDIVFQTKLLSFNASVEAARAGEHGKGFAVVAEEVGNLASMSGKAALEISEMLESSINQVNDIVKSSNEKVQKLISQNKEKVDRGTVIASECGESLDRILKNVESVNEMVYEISTATSEQSTGVQEITKAMQQFDQVTQQNTAASQSSANMASELKESAHSLNQSVNELAGLIHGSTEESTPKNSGSGRPPKNNVVKLPISKSPQIDKNIKTEVKTASGSDVYASLSDDARFEDM